MADQLWQNPSFKFYTRKDFMVFTFRQSHQVLHGSHGLDHIVTLRSDEVLAQPERFAPCTTIRLRPRSEYQIFPSFCLLFYLSCHLI